MRIRTKYAVTTLRRRSRCIGNTLLPILGLAAVHIEDGRALLFPGSGGCIVVDWFRFCKFERRRKQLSVQVQP